MEQPMHSDIETPLVVLLDLYRRNQPWVFSLVAAVLVGFSGVLPLFIVPLEAGVRLKQREGEKKLRLLLSFAVGGLVGDVFLHLLPEALRHTRDEREQIQVGLWVIGGVLFFTMLEMMFTNIEEESPGDRQHDQQHHQPAATTQLQSNGHSMCSSDHQHLQKRRLAMTSELRQHDEEEDRQFRQRVITSNNNVLHSNCNGSRDHKLFDTPPSKKLASGYLNLLANSVDNFTHGVAIGGSFLASTKVGMLTTFAILIHEIPHEVGDFAILLKSGFSRWEAAKAQMATASLGVMGAICALIADDSQALGERTAWILPFTAGGFIQIALVGVLPEVTKERELVQCLKQSCCLLAGVLVMLAVTVMFQH